ncbi:MAG: hypothetical protein E7604_14670 [Ruminococcaceae bacterium]|nr:hypothetical protein [Oscillospiraceae bacterium]
MPDNRKPLKYGAFPVCRNYTVRAYLCNDGDCERHGCENSVGDDRTRLGDNNAGHLLASDSGNGSQGSNIERGIGKSEPSTVPPPEKPAEEPAKGVNEPFIPYKGKIRKSGSGCIYKINDHLYEGSFSPTHANGKRVKHNVYAETREEVEVKLAELIERVREEIQIEKEEMMKGSHEM